MKTLEKEKEAGTDMKYKKNTKNRKEQEKFTSKEISQMIFTEYEISVLAELLKRQN